ncbi:MAG: hypothetical protein GY723_22340 [bacterium]|nr:hypothetical protein [bacterium]
MLTRALLATLALGSGACASYPVAPPQLPPTVAPKLASDSVAYVVGCDPQPEPDGFLTCEALVSRLAIQLRDASIFAAVLESTPPSDSNPVVVTVRPYRYRPYFFTPGHNPAFALLSLAIPFWWSEPVGYRFALDVAPHHDVIEVDTTWKGTFVMWGLSSILNIAPSRTFESAYSQDSKRIRAAVGLGPEPHR